MTALTILSRCERHKAVVGETEVTYYTAAVSHTGAVSWRFARRTEFTLPRHVMLDVVGQIVDHPVVHRGR